MGEGGIEGDHPRVAILLQVVRQPRPFNGASFLSSQT